MQWFSCWRVRIRTGPGGAEQQVQRRQRAGQRLFRPDGIPGVEVQNVGVRPLFMGFRVNLLRLMSKWPMHVQSVPPPPT